LAPCLVSDGIGANGWLEYAVEKQPVPIEITFSHHWEIAAHFAVDDIQNVRARDLMVDLAHVQAVLRQVIPVIYYGRAN